MLSFQLKNKKLLIAGLGLTLLFFIYRTIFTIHSQDQLTFYSLRKHTAIGAFEGRNATLYSDMDSLDKTLTFSVRPSLEARGDAIHYLKFSPDSVTTSDIEENFYQFKNLRLLVWDKEFNTQLFFKRISVDAVLLSQNSAVSLEEIIKTVNPKMILIDGTNSDYRITEWAQQSKNLSIKCYFLKKNPAYSINLE
jgi:competence protein ComEC